MITTLTLLLAGATVSLPLDAEVRGREVELGEIAVVTAADASTLQRLEQLSLGYAPSPGYSRVLTAEQVAAEVRRALPGIEVSFAGFSACRVRPAIERVEADEIRATAEVEMLRLIGTSDVGYTAAAEIRGLDVPASEGVYQLRARATNRDLNSGTISVPVQVLVNGELYRTVWTSWTLERFETVPVLTRPVQAGQVIAPDMLERRRVAITTSGSARPLTSGLVAGAIAAHDLPAGNVVTGHDVHRPVAVEQGRTIQLEVQKGRIIARVTAMARESGAVGDRVRIITRDGGRELTGTVIGQDTVRVSLGGAR